MMTGMEKKLKSIATTATTEVSPQDGNRFGFTNHFLPRFVKIKSPGNVEVWQFYHLLEVKIKVAVESKASKKPLARYMTFKQQALKTYTHLCKLCLKQINDKENATNMSWLSAYCKQKTASNAEVHLNQHAEHPKVVEYFKKKENKRKSTGVFSSGREDPVHEGALMKKMTESRRDTQVQLITKWLVFNHLPHSVTQRDEFKAMIQFFDPNYVPLARRTFLKEVKKMFDQMVDNIIKLLDDEGITGLWAVSITHDIWNTIIMDGALGSSLRIVTRDMEMYTIAAVLKRHNANHKAANVAAILEEVYQTR